MRFRPIKTSLFSQGLLFFVLLGCLTPIDIPVEDSFGRLVIGGQVSTLAGRNIIQVGVTASTERLPFPLSDVAIALVDDFGGVQDFMEDSKYRGTYTLPTFSATPGRSYYVHVTLPNGKVYESVPEKMPLDSGTVLTRYEIIDETNVDSEGTILTQPYVKVYANSTLAANQYVLWDLQEDFMLSPTDFPDPFGYTPPSCFISQAADPQKITLFNGDGIINPSIDNLLVGSRLIDWSFWEKHYFTTYQSIISKEAFAYWKKVDILANQKGSIFDTPPADITGNLYNVNDPAEKVLGYVQVTNQAYHRFYILNGDLPFWLTWSNCTYDNRDYAFYPTRCLDCLSARNSTYNRPAWF